MDAADSVQGDGERETTRSSSEPTFEAAAVRGLIDGSSARVGDPWPKVRAACVESHVVVGVVLGPFRARRSRDRAACCARCAVYRASCCRVVCSVWWPSWDPLEALLGASWGALGALLGPLGSQVAKK